MTSRRTIFAKYISGISANLMLSLAVAAMFAVATALYWAPAEAQNPSTDATLSELSVSPKDIIGFNSTRMSYDVGVDSTVATATVTATANDAAAMVAFNTIDADGVIDGHQVTLSSGRNEVTVTVTAEDGTTKQEYTVSVNQGVTDAKGWQAGADLDGLIAAGNDDSTGIWSDGETMWVAEYNDAEVYAYTRADGSRNTSKDITLDSNNNTSTGIWFNDDTMWVADFVFAKIYAYTRADGSRDTGKDIDTLVDDILLPWGIWSNDETMWVADWADATIYAYTLSDGTRNASKDIDTLAAAGNGAPSGIWSDGETLWVADDLDAKIYAYWLSDGLRNPGQDFDTLAEAGNEYPRGIWSDGTTMWVADAVTDKVYAYNMPPPATLMDARLSELKVSPKDIIGFDPARMSYDVGVDSTVTTATITATANNSAAMVDFNTIDAVGVTDGHQVTLSSGRNEVTVTVTAEDGTTKQEYTVSVNQGVTDAKGWKAGADLDGLIAVDNLDPAGVWANDDTMWVTDFRDEKLYAYTRADGAPDTDKDIPLVSDHGFPYGIWSNGTTTMWVADFSGSKIYAYLTTDGMRDPDQDIPLHTDNNASRCIWSDGTTMWVVDGGALRLYAYTLVGGTRDADEDIPLHADNDTPRAIWSNGTTMWVSDSTDDKLYAYTRSDSTWARDESRDFDTLSGPPGNDEPRGIWSDGTTMWVADSTDDKVYAYNMPPPSTDATLSELTVSPKDIIGFDPTRESYEVGVDSTVTTATITATANDAAAMVDFNTIDAVGVTDGHQVTLSSGRNEVTVTVTAEDGTTKQEYTVSVNQGVTDAKGWKAGADLDGLTALAIPFPMGIWANDDTMWVADFSDPTIYAYKVTDGTRDTTQDIGLGFFLNDEPYGIWSNGETMWVADYDDDKLYAYTLSGGTWSRDTTHEFNLDSDNDEPTGIWSDKETMWVADSSDDKVYAYTLSGGTWSRDTTHEFNLDSDNDAPTGIWSNGTTMWVADLNDATLYAYTESGGTWSRDVYQNFDTLVAAGNREPTGIWSGGTTMWVADSDDGKIYAYNMPPPSVRVNFGQSTYTVDEGSTVSVSVSLSEDPERTVTIPITATNQGSTTAADYTVPGSVTFHSGETIKNITFEAVNDIDNDDGETVKLTFGASLPAGVTVGATTATTVSISDSVKVSFGQATYTVDEGSTVSVSVTLSADPERTVTIPVTAADQGGATAADYRWSPSSVIFHSGETTQNITFMAVDDSDNDDGESVKFTFGASLPMRVSAAGITETTVSINDDDVPSLTVGFGQSTYTVAEGSTVNVSVFLSADPERTVTIPVTATNQGSTTAADYSWSPGSVTFDSGETTKNITFMAVNDIYDENDETVVLSFDSPLPPAVSEGSIPETEVSITDSGLRPHIVAPSTVNVDEDSTTTFDVYLSHRPSGNVTVTATSTDTSTVSVQPATLSFSTTSWNTPQSVTVRSAADDDAIDDTVTVRLTASGGEYGNISRSVFVKVIDD